jgi:2-polyprenyl-3-methyl-5-hydroxy-6-metoxy-1,4-benzoquinol methylase
VATRAVHATAYDRAVEETTLRERVASFPQWHYEIELDDVRTPIFDPAHVNRHAQRKRYFFEPLVRLCGGSLAGRRVLDLGCNAGFWSLAAVEAGAEFVLGIDGRQMHVDQANLVFDAKGVAPARYRFELADIFDLELQEEPFDIVLCLGLLYHVSKPFELMERIAGWNSDLVVIDTTLDNRVRGPYFRVVGQDLDDPRSAVDRPVALHPTSEAVARLADTFGYRSAMLQPRFTRWEGSTSYRDGRRRAFICAKQTPLTGLDTQAVGANAGASPPRPAARPSSSARLRGRLRASLRSARRRIKVVERRLAERRAKSS